MNQGETRIEYVAIDEIRRWSRNPKLHDQDELIESFDRFGFVAPLIYDETQQQLVAGHGRLNALTAMKERGDEPPERIKVEGDKWLVPILRGISFANEDEAAAYAIADNRLVEAGGWDNQATIDILLDMDARHIPF